MHRVGDDGLLYTGCVAKREEPRQLRLTSEKRTSSGGTAREWEETLCA